MTVLKCIVYHVLDDNEPFRAPHLVPVGAKAVELACDGRRLSSDAGSVLLKDIADPLGLTRALAAVLSNRREARRIHFTPEDSLTQRVFQVVVGQGQGG